MNNNQCTQAPLDCLRGSQISMEAILAYHPALSTEYCIVLQIFGALKFRWRVITERSVYFTMISVSVDAVVIAQCVFRI